MAGELDRLSVVLEAETRPLREGFRRVEDRLEQFDRKYRRSFQNNSRVTDNFARSIARMGGVIATVAAPAVIGAFVQRTLAASEALADTADRVGFATDRLQELRFAADQNGSSVNTLDMALQRFSRRLGEAANGSGELLGSLRETGIQLRDSDGRMRSSYDILLDYADAVRDAESDQRALSLAFKAFDSEGASLVTLLRQGREGIEQWGASAREAGLVLEDGLVRQGAEVNRVFRVMQQQINAEATSAVLAHAEGLERLGEALAGIASWGVRAAATMGTFADSFRLQGQLEDPRERRMALRGAAIDLRRSMGRGDDVALDMASPLANALTEALGSSEAAVTIRALRDELGSGFRNMELEGAALASAAARLDSLADSLMPNGASSPSSAGGVGGTGGGSGGSGGSNPSDPLAPLPPPIRVGARGEGGMRSPMPSESGIDKITTIFAEQVGEKTPGKMAEGFTDQQQKIANGLEAGLRAAFEGNAIDFFANNLRNKAFSALADALTSAFASGSGKGGFFGQAIGALFGIGSGGKRAAGGPVSAGRAYLVGENGPEIMASGAAGTVINAAATRALAGNMSTRSTPSVVQQHFHLNAQGAVLTADLLREMENKANESASRMGRMVFEATQEQMAMNERGQSRTLGLP